MARYCSISESLADYKELESKFRRLKQEVKTGIDLKTLFDPNSLEEKTEALNRGETAYLEFCSKKKEFEEISRKPEIIDKINKEKDAFQTYNEEGMTTTRNELGILAYLVLTAGGCVY